MIQIEIWMHCTPLSAAKQGCSSGWRRRDLRATAALGNVCSISAHFDVIETLDRTDKTGTLAAATEQTFTARMLSD